MDSTYIFLQHYWWFIISLLAAALVFMLFVQGGQGLLYALGKTPLQRSMIVNSLGRKWELTFTTLVTFGGAFFASFPLFYSTSFGGAVYLWMAILFFFVIQAVSYEFRSKPGNFLGQKTYEWFLMLNGVFGTFLLGAAVATFFTGANFIVEKGNITNFGGDATISRWTSPWHGLEALADYRNLALGLAVLCLSRILGAQFIMKTVDDVEVSARARKQIKYTAAPFVILFLVFVVSIMVGDGWAVDPATGVISKEPFKYFHNLVRMPAVAAVFVAGVLAVLAGIWVALFSKKCTGIVYTGAGTVLAVLGLMLLAGYNHTAYYPSLADASSSLTLYNSSSSRFTLTVMAWVSLAIPFVAWYISYAWRALTRRKVTPDEAKPGEGY